jgi:membrane associated rhomboid family serine protease
MYCPECVQPSAAVAQKPAAAGWSQAKVTLTLIAVNTLLGLAFIPTGSGGILTPTTSAIFEALDLYGPLVAEGEWHRLLTGGFVHEEMFYLALNMVLLWFVGIRLEPVLGSERFTILYFTSLLAGSFTILLLEPEFITVGAQAPVFGVAGATFVLLGHRLKAGEVAGIIFGMALVLLYGAELYIHVAMQVGGLAAGVACALAVKAHERGWPGKSRRSFDFAAMAIIVISVAGSLIVVKSEATLYEDEAEKIERQLAATPRNPKLLLSLAQTRVNAGDLRLPVETGQNRWGLTPEPPQGSLPSETIQQYRKANEAWLAYLRVARDPNLYMAMVMARRLLLLAGGVQTRSAALAYAEAAAEAQEIVVNRKPTETSLSDYSIYLLFTFDYAAAGKAKREALGLVKTEALRKAVIDRFEAKRKSAEKFKERLREPEGSDRAPPRAPNLTWSRWCPQLELFARAPGCSRAQRAIVLEPEITSPSSRIRIGTSLVPLSSRTSARSSSRRAQVHGISL